MSQRSKNKAVMVTTVSTQQACTSYLPKELFSAYRFLLKTPPDFIEMQVKLENIKEVSRG